MRPYAVRDLQEAVHLGDGVPANVFNSTPAAGSPTVSLREHPAFRDALGLPSDSALAQSHPGLPPPARELPGQRAALEVGKQAEELMARREAILTPGRLMGTPGAPPTAAEPFQPNTVAAATRFPWEPAVNVPPTQCAPPKEYAAADAGFAERARFRGVRKVDTPLAGESFPEPGGILNQGNFAQMAPRRWDDLAFENRLKHAIGHGPHTPANHVHRAAHRSVQSAASRRPMSAQATPRGGRTPRATPR